MQFRDRIRTHLRKQLQNADYFVGAGKGVSRKGDVEQSVGVIVNQGDHEVIMIRSTTGTAGCTVGA